MSLIEQYVCNEGVCRAIEVYFDTLVEGISIQKAFEISDPGSPFMAETHKKEEVARALLAENKALHAQIVKKVKDI